MEYKSHTEVIQHFFQHWQQVVHLNWCMNKTIPRCPKKRPLNVYKETIDPCADLKKKKKVFKIITMTKTNTVLNFFQIYIVIIANIFIQQCLFVCV